MDIEYTIRHATAADAAAVTDLLRVSYTRLMAPAHDAGLLRRALPLITRARPELLRSGTYFVAEAGDGTLVSCGGWTRAEPGTGAVEAGVAHVRHFAVHPDWTRRGIGRALYRRSEEQVRAAGVARFRCQASLNAQAFYAALGFSPLARIDVPLGAGLLFPAMLMERRIPPR